MSLRWTGRGLETPCAVFCVAFCLVSCGGGALSPDGARADATAEARDGATDATGPATTLRAGLAAAWSFDGDGKDRSGHALDLAVDGLTFPAGRFAKGVQFAGAGSKIAQRPSSDPSLDFATGDFTVSFWLQFARTGSPQFVAVKNYDGGWFVGWAQTEWAFGLPAPATGGHFADPAGSPATGVFHHVVFLRGGTTAQLLVDGKSVGTQTVADSAPPAPAPFQVGGYSPGGVGAGQSVVDGIVDDLAIWRRALDEGELGYLSTHAVPPAP